MKRFLSILLCVSLSLTSGCFTTAQIEAAKPTAIQLATPFGFAVGQYIYKHNPTLATKLLPDVEAFLGDVLTKNTPVLSDDITTFVNAEATKVGLPVSDATALDNILLTQIVLVQSQFQTDVTNKLGTTVTQILVNFDAGLKQASGLQPTQ